MTYELPIGIWNYQFDSVDICWCLYGSQWLGKIQQRHHWSLHANGIDVWRYLVGMAIIEGRVDQAAAYHFGGRDFGIGVGGD